MVQLVPGHLKHHVRRDEDLLVRLNPTLYSLLVCIGSKEAENLVLLLFELEILRYPQFEGQVLEFVGPTFVKTFIQDLLQNVAFFVQI